MGFLGEAFGKKVPKNEQPAAIPQVTERQQQIADAAFARGDAQYAWMQDLQAKQQPITNAAVATMTGAGATSLGRSGSQWGQYQQLFQPVNAAVAHDAMSWDSPARQESEAARAISEATRQYGTAGENMGVQMARYGLRPQDYQIQQLELARAGAATTAANDARRQVQLQGVGLRQQAAGLGSNIAGQAYANQGQGATLTGAGAELGQNANTAAINQRNAAWIPSWGVGTQNLAGAGQTANTAYGIDTRSYGDTLDYNMKSKQIVADVVGTIAGGAMASSKQVKKDKRPVREGVALDKLESLPVEKWTYKKGAGDGGTHVGPYAEDVRDRFGEGAAPGGKAIDIISMQGITVAAIKDLAGRVKKLEAARRGVGSAR